MNQVNSSKVMASKCTHPTSYRRQLFLIFPIVYLRNYPNSKQVFSLKRSFLQPSKFLLNLENLQKNGSWGAFHELGHNMQDPMWTFSGTGEVTCNIFTLHAMEKLTGQKPWEHPWVAGKRNKMETYLKAGADFAEWTKDAGLALAIYAQLARDMGSVNLS